jgi:hypothetical protein
VPRAAILLLWIGLLLAGCGDALGALGRLDCASGCKLPNAIGVCAADDCAVERCYTGFGDCNGTPDDGCEADLSSDVNHCGACANACGGCARGSCRAIETLASRPKENGISTASDLRVMGSSVYWINGFSFASGAVPPDLLAVDKTGGEARVVVAGGDRLETLGADQASLYAIALDDELAEDGVHRVRSHRVLRIEPDSGRVTELARRDGEPVSKPLHDGDHVYWGFRLRHPTEPTFLPGSAVMRVPRAGGDAEPVKLWEIEGGPTAVAARDGAVYWAGVMATELGFELDVTRWSSQTSTGTTLRTGIGASCLIADETDLYVLNVFAPDGLESRLSRLPLAGGEPQLLWKGAGAVQDCVGSSRHVYFTLLDGSIQQVEKATGNASVVAGAQILARSLATDDEFLYWATKDEVRRVGLE